MKSTVTMPEELFYKMLNSLKDDNTIQCSACTSFYKKEPGNCDDIRCPDFQPFKNNIFDQITFNKVNVEEKQCNQ